MQRATRPSLLHLLQVPRGSQGAGSSWGAAAMGLSLACNKSAARMNRTGILHKHATGRHHASQASPESGRDWSNDRWLSIETTCASCPKVTKRLKLQSVEKGTGIKLSRKKMSHKLKNYRDRSKVWIHLDGLNPYKINEGPYLAGPGPTLQAHGPH